MARSYGKALLKDGFWLVKAEPHVALQLKRMFARVGKSTVGTIKLKATDEVTRKLLWFTQLYPMDVRPREELEQRAARYDADREAFEGLISGSASPTKYDLAIPAREYQRVAADVLLRGRGLLLGDEVGLGKTASAICALSDPRMRPALVVTLTALPLQWQREIKRFCPQLRTHIIRSSKPYDVRSGAGSKRRDQLALVEPEFPDVIITSYSKLASWADALAGKVKSAVFDEGQELRRRGDKKKPSAKYEAAKLIASQCDYRAALTATPIYNFGEEFYNVLSILKPDALGTRSEFVTEWCSHGHEDGKARIRDPQAFGTYLRDSGLMLRRTRSDVGRELPALQRAIHHCDSDERVIDDVRGAAGELARKILAQETSFHDRGAATRELDWRLRQATGISKAPHVASFVEMLVENGERVVLYAWHRTVYDIYLERLKNYRPVMFTGSESPAQKESSREAFIKGYARVLIMSLRAGAGLDGLQFVSRTCVFGELDWSFGAMLQCEGRLYRDGQPDPVIAYYLVSDSGSDPFVSETLGLKRAQLEGAIDPKADPVSLQVDTKEALRRMAEQYLAKKPALTTAAEATV